MASIANHHRIFDRQVPHIWAKVIKGLDPESIDAFRLTCKGFYNAFNYTIVDRPKLKVKIRMEARNLELGATFALPLEPIEASLPRITAIKADRQDIFLGLAWDNVDCALFRVNKETKKSEYLLGPIKYQYISSIQCSKTYVVVCFGPGCPSFKLYHRIGSLRPTQFELPQHFGFTLIAATKNDIWHIYRICPQEPHSFECLVDESFVHVGHVHMEDNVYTRAEVVGERCVLHNPSDIKMVNLPSLQVVWQTDEVTMTRLSVTQIQGIDTTSELVRFSLPVRPKSGALVTIDAGSGEIFSIQHSRKIRNFIDTHCNEMHGAWQLEKASQSFGGRYHYTVKNLQTFEELNFQTHLILRRWIVSDDNIIGLEEDTLVMYCLTMSGKRIRKTKALPVKGKRLVTKCDSDCLAYFAHGRDQVDLTLVNQVNKGYLIE